MSEPKMSFIDFLKYIRIYYDEYDEETEYDGISL